MKYVMLLFVVIVLTLLLAQFIAAGKRAHQASLLPRSSPSPSPATQLANPASVNCTQQGGTVEIKTMPGGGQYGLCVFEDNYACEEWAMLRGNCPVGGLRTTGFDTEAQKYCAWLGGQTLAEKNATCTLPDGTVCTDEALFHGTCPASP